MVNISEANKLAAMLDRLDLEEAQQVLDNVKAGRADFETGGYRFIFGSEIDGIMAEELGDDEYTLGCVSDWFAADILGISADAIKKMQQADLFAAIGELLMPHLDRVQAGIVASDGYGPHFAHYDGEEHSFQAENEDGETVTVYAFRVD